MTAPGWGGGGAPPPRERLTAAEALARVLAAVAPLPGEAVALGDALGRVLASAVASPVTLPPWNASAMDGYAVRSTDVAGATADAPVSLAVDGTVAAGAEDPRPLPGVTARRIMTGAPLPSGADAVVRIEDTDGGATRVRVRRAPAAGRDVRQRGEDVRAGDVVLRAGAALGASQVGLLAACAVGEVWAYRRPRVALLGSGDELVPLERAAEAVAGRRLVGSNAYALAAAVREAGGVPVDLGLARDTPASVRGRLAGAAGCDLVVTTAGVSKGEFDCMHEAVAGMGGAAALWAVRMRPGAPMGFGRVGAGSFGIPWVGLPGNPGAALVGFELFVRPAIRRMAGHAALYRRTVPVVLDQAVTLAAPVLHLLRVTLAAGAEEDGPARDEPARARLAGGQGAGRLTTAAWADALLVVPAGRTRCEAGEPLRAIPLAEGAHGSTPPI